MNRWGIPKWLEDEVKKRDKYCVYCGVHLIDIVPSGDFRKAMATWEHIINDASIITRENIARCCASCNSSKGAKLLSDWIQSSYCKKKNIREQTVAMIIRESLKKSLKKNSDGAQLN